MRIVRVAGAGAAAGDLPAAALLRRRPGVPRAGGAEGWRRPKTSLEMPTSTGQRRQMRRIGTLEFTLKGQPLTLTAFVDASDNDLRRLFVPFGDLTNGAETYPGGRYLDLDRTATGVYDLDFNRAYHPFCLFNADVRLPVRRARTAWRLPIRAGEQLGTSTTSDIAAIVFDFDGVLADSEPLHLRAYQDVLEPLGISLTREEYYAQLSRLRRRGRVQGHRGGAALAARRRATARPDRREGPRVSTSSIASGDVLYPGRDGLRHAARRGVSARHRVGRAAAARSRRCSRASRLDRSLPLHRRLGRHRGEQAGARSVPTRRRAARPAARRCVAIEDSRWGIASAKAAGLWCIGITNTYPRGTARGGCVIVARSTSSRRGCLIRARTRPDSGNRSLQPLRCPAQPVARISQCSVRAPSSSEGGPGRGGARAGDERAGRRARAGGVRDRAGRVSRRSMPRRTSRCSTDGRCGGGAPRAAERRPIGRRRPRASTSTSTTSWASAATASATTIRATASSTKCSTAAPASRSASRSSTSRSRRRAGLRVAGVNFPGHFLLRAPVTGPLRARRCATTRSSSIRSIAARCSRKSIAASCCGSTSATTPPSTARCSTRRRDTHIVVRMLVNLKRLYVRMRSFPQARFISDLLLAVGSVGDSRTARSRPARVPPAGLRRRAARSRSVPAAAAEQPAGLADDVATFATNRDDGERRAAVGTRTDLGAREDAAPARRRVQLISRVANQAPSRD